MHTITISLTQSACLLQHWIYSMGHIIQKSWDQRISKILGFSDFGSLRKYIYIYLPQKCLKLISESQNNHLCQQNHL
jgi:hypothetical protein